MFPYSLFRFACLAFLISGCSMSNTQFVVEPDTSDQIIYSYEGGELGAEAMGLVIHGDGQVKYAYTYPYNGSWPQESIELIHQLSPTETQELFQGLVDAGLFSLKNVSYGGVDVYVTKITASVDGYELDVNIEGTPDEGIEKLIHALIFKIQQEWIVQITLHVNEGNEHITCEFEANGSAKGERNGDGSTITETGWIPLEEIAAIWNLSGMLNPSLYPLGTEVTQACADCMELIISFDNGQLMHIVWSAGEIPIDPAVQLLSEMIIGAMWEGNETGFDCG